MPSKKRPVGRPRKPDRERRDYVVHMRLNKAEHARVRRMAAERGCSMSILARIETLGR